MCSQLINASSPLVPLDSLIDSLILTLSSLLQKSLLFPTTSRLTSLSPALYLCLSVLSTPNPWNQASEQEKPSNAGCYHMSVRMWMPHQAVKPSSQTTASGDFSLQPTPLLFFHWTLPLSSNSSLISCLNTHTHQYNSTYTGWSGPSVVQGHTPLVEPCPISMVGIVRAELHWSACIQAEAEQKEECQAGYIPALPFMQSVFNSWKAGLDLLLKKTPGRKGT